MRASPSHAIRSSRCTRILRFSAAALPLALGCAGASAQNLVVNGDFATDLSGWQIQPQGQAEPSPADLDDSPASGSVLLRNAEAGAGVRVYPLRQCVLLTSRGYYAVGGFGRVPVGQTTAPLVFAFNAYYTTDCTGNTGSIGAQFIRTTSWNDVEFLVRIDTAPSSMEIRLGLEKTPAGGEATGNIDHVFVELLDLVFFSGFE